MISINKLKLRQSKNEQFALQLSSLHKQNQTSRSSTCSEQLRFSFCTDSRGCSTWCFHQQFYSLNKKSRIKLSINDEYDYLDLEQKTTNSKILWNTDSILPIELPPHNKENDLTFQLYKDGNYVGKARSFVQFGRNKKDCLDIVNKNFQIVGKLLYEAVWMLKTYQEKIITLEQYYKDGRGTNQPNPYTTVTIEQQKYQKSKRQKSQSTKKYNGGREIFQYNQKLNEQENVGCFSCFSSKRSMSVLDQVELRKLRNYAILYEENEVKFVKGENLVPQTIQKPMFYSQKPYRAKQQST